MTFLIAVLICIAVPMFYCIKALTGLVGSPAGNAEKARTPIPPYLLLALVPAWPMAAGFMMGVFPPAEFKPHNYINYIPHLFLAGGVAGVIIFGYIASRKRVDVRGKVQQGGIWILATLAGAYLTFTAVDHLIFFADKESTGVMDTGVLPTMAGVKCDAPFLLARKDGHAFEYRCPTNLQLGHQLGQPFVPWPSYTAGRSEQLMNEYQNMEAEIARQSK